MNNTMRVVQDMSYSKRLMVWSSEVNILSDVNNVADQNLSQFLPSVINADIFFHSFFHFYIYFFVFFYIFFMHFSQILSVKPNSGHNTQLVFLSSMASGIKR